VGETAFLGYSQLSSQAKVVALIVDGKPATGALAGQKVELVLDSSPFYAESGGQVGDRGVLTLAGESGQLSVRVTDVQKAGGGRLFLHSGEVEGNGQLAVGARVTATVDSALRRRVRHPAHRFQPVCALVRTCATQRSYCVFVRCARRTQTRCHHTATHLLQAALKQVVSDDISQAGSLVDFDRLRFDFNSAVTPTAQQLSRVEQLVNGALIGCLLALECKRSVLTHCLLCNEKGWIGDSVALQSTSMGIKEARASGAVAMFGEKYGDVVRVVDVPGVSMELCGGTHVDNTSEIGGFKVRPARV
jgi:alanyl-tRNA synthetase